jgi:hypothetical protein
VPGTVHLGKLDLMVQAAMGWTNSHLHCFRIGKLSYGPVDDLADDVIDRDEKTLAVSEAFEAERRLVYEYDFGDSWEHRLLVEKADVPFTFAGIATCTAGKRACPPEDCGGSWGYANLLEALSDPDHEEHEESLEWLGEEFDPEEFEPKAVNALLGRFPSRRERAR